MLKYGPTCKTMDELWYNIYHQSKTLTIEPTSHCIKGHIKRSLYGTFLMIHCLTCATLNPRSYEFEEVNGILMPCPCIHTLPEDAALSCNCEKCAARRCLCRQYEVPSCVFCKCQAGTQFKNRNTTHLKRIVAKGNQLN